MSTEATRKAALAGKMRREQDDAQRVRAMSFNVTPSGTAPQSRTTSHEGRLPLQRENNRERIKQFSIVYYTIPIVTVDGEGRREGRGKGQLEGWEKRSEKRVPQAV